MIPNVQNLALSAIRNKRRLLIRYAGKPRSRTVEPHLVYRSENGIVTVLCYQVRGYHSSKRQDSFWRPFQLRKIDSIRVTDELFTARLKEGFRSVCDLIRGSTIAQIGSEADSYMHFDTAVYGPPTPAYLETTPSLTMRIGSSDTPVSVI